MTLRPLFNALLDSDFTLVRPAWPPISTTRFETNEGAAVYGVTVKRLGPIQIVHKRMLSFGLSVSWASADGTVVAASPPN
jgi:hypothetical protein